MSLPHRFLQWVAAVLGLMFISGHIVLSTLHTDLAARSFDAHVVHVPPALSAPRFFLDTDSYAWLAHTRELMESGDWRIRHTQMDNAPFGRELHWSHPLLWGIRGLTTLFMEAKGWPLARALDLAGVWIMPAFQFALLSLAFFLLLRKLGWGAAGLFVFLCLAFEPLASVFHPRMPDHHGLQVFAAFLSLLCLGFGGMGWVRTENPALFLSPVRAFRPLDLPAPAEARRWFAVAGVFGAIGLWLGGTVWIFTFAFAGAAALSVIPLFLRSAPTLWRYTPELWRIWAWTGVLFSAAFYLLEYAPNHFAMRLEVNHPLYWLAWIGGAESLIFAARSSSFRFWRGRSAREWAGLTLGLLAALALPAAILLGPIDWHLMRHPILYQMSNQHTTECLPGLLRIGTDSWRFLLAAFGILPLAAILLNIPVRRRNRPHPFSTALLIYTLLFAALFLRQSRWLPFLLLSLTALVILELSQRLSTPGSGSRLGFAILVALLLNGAWADTDRYRMESQASQMILPPVIWGEALAAKYTALRIGLAAGSDPWQFIGTFNIAPQLFYFTGIPSVASFYWENLAGWQAEIAFYADGPDGKTARTISAERGLTHAMGLPPDHWAALQNMQEHMRPSGTTGYRATLTDRMVRSDPLAPPPGWMCRENALSAALSERLLLRTPTDHVHLQSPSTVYALTPGPHRKPEHN